MVDIVLLPRHTERFWKKTRVNPERTWNGVPCLEWTGRRDSHGYGEFRVAKHKQFRAHRVALTMSDGPLPEGVFALHHCDNPPCVNPLHLFRGSPSDNMKDMIAKGRGNKDVGEGNPSSKLTEAEVRQIRRCLAAGGSQRQVASDFGVSQTTVWYIAKRVTWAHVA